MFLRHFWCLYFWFNFLGNIFLLSVFLRWLKSCCVRRLSFTTSSTRAGGGPGWQRSTTSVWLVRDGTYWCWSPCDRLIWAGFALLLRFNSLSPLLYLTFVSFPDARETQDYRMSHIITARNMKTVKISLCGQFHVRLSHHTQTDGASIWK